jgi:predicted ArsR family transcriptional regulator
MSADELDVVEGMLRRQEQVSQAVVGQLVGEVRRLEEKAERLREALAQAGGGMVPA